MFLEFISIGIFLVLATCFVAVAIGFCAAKLVGPAGKLKQGRRFVDNGNGTVLDTKTGLVWLNRSIGEYSWNDANKAVDGICGGWRLPTVVELIGVLDYSRRGMAGMAVSEISDLCQLNRGCYWSRTAFLHSTYEDQTSHRWFVSLQSGLVGHSDHAYEYFVWPVKGVAH